MRTVCPGCTAVAIAETMTGAVVASVADSPADHALLDRASAVIPDLFSWLDALDSPPPFSDKPEPQGVARLVIGAGSRQLVVIRGSERAVIALVTPRTTPLFVRAANAFVAENASAA